MPTSRIRVRRDLTQAVKHLKWIQEYLVRSGRLYDGDYPKHYQMFCALLVIADTLETGLTELRSHL